MILCLTQAVECVQDTTAREGFYHIPTKCGCDDNMIFHLTPNSLFFFFCGFTSSQAHRNLRHPSITGVSMSHEWALIRDEVICVWGRYCSQRHTKTRARPEGFVGDETSRRPVWLKRLPLGSRKTNEMHFGIFPLVKGSCAERQRGAAECWLALTSRLPVLLS